MPLPNIELHHELHVVKTAMKHLVYWNRHGKDDAPPCPDVLLLDLNLPKVEGTQVLTNIPESSSLRPHASYCSDLV